VLLNQEKLDPDVTAVSSDPPPWQNDGFIDEHHVIYFQRPLFCFEQTKLLSESNCSSSDKMARSKEDIAWFKSTFHPIPKAALPDDCIEYTICALSSSLDITNDSETRNRLKAFQKYSNEMQKEWLKDYIWQRQGFSLELEKEDGEVGNQKQGQSRFG
jgi:hypothetical protein